MKRYQVIVVGGGHAGIEAAQASVRAGADTCMITFKHDAIGRMSCNPAIGGVAKGQIVREIDALGGAMGKLIDHAGIQFRMLNTSKGAAVISPRAQADKDAYQRAAQELCESTDGLTIIEGEVVEMMLDDDRVTGVVTGDGATIAGERVVLTTGTFLGGLLHYGEDQIEGGRAGEKATHGLSRQFKDLGFRTGRLKTGTPPRLDANTIDWGATTEQLGDDPPVPFSFLTPEITGKQVSCFITHTNANTHAIIERNLHRSPLYSGQITGIGPRYCPSIEDKVKRFPDKDSHHVFLEPEGLDSDEVYPNGISTSIARDVQDEIVQSIVGLERAKILKYGYAVEYDFIPPTQIQSDLQSRLVRGLYLAGQINGTTGYEEAGAQGLMAGLNAALSVRGVEPLVLRRDQAYIGVLIDDLTTRGTEEPYRMFTSLAEYRLRLRTDNADRRLTPIARGLGILDTSRAERFAAKMQAFERGRELLNTRSEGKSFWERLRTPSYPWTEIEAALPEIATLDREALATLEIDGRYDGYLEREQAEVERMYERERVHLPDGLDYAGITGLRNEAREKLSDVRPSTLGQAGRVPGIGPADLAVLRVHLGK